MTRLSKVLARLAACRRGVSSVEFAVMAPVFLAVTAGAVDVGGMLLARSTANSAAASAAVAAIASASLVNAEEVEALGRRTAAAAADRAGNGTVTVTFNGSFTAARHGTKTTVHGSSSAADLCFCPGTTAEGRMDFGPPLQCGAPCQSGGYAGKFVEVRVSRPWAPLFGGLGLVGDDGRVSARAVAAVQ